MTNSRVYPSFRVSKGGARTRLGARISRPVSRFQRAHTHQGLVAVDDSEGPAGEALL